MAHEQSGKIKEIFETQTFPSGFSKREFVVTTDERYPQDIKFDCLKEKADMLNDFKAGDAVRVSFDIRGREYNGRYYVDLNAWKIDLSDAGGAQSESTPPGDGPPSDSIPEDTTDYGADSGDDIPF